MKNTLRATVLDFFVIKCGGVPVKSCDEKLCSTVYLQSGREYAEVLIC